MGFSLLAPVPPAKPWLYSGNFLVHHSLVEFNLKEKRKKDTSIEVTFLGNNVTSSVKITMYVSVLWLSPSFLCIYVPGQGTVPTTDLLACRSCRFGISTTLIKHSVF